ncbi:MAG TPA: low affinity iron permease family protein [Bryobacteraceae bacterium]|nr:low affinity iron permease family protein [Bryobacteraceae bacterium]
MDKNERFRRFATRVSEAVGSPQAFLLAVAATGIWLLCGRYFRFSDAWQLVINTSTSVATFLIVFLIQNTQNRNARVMQMKLDELIRALGPARTELVHMESMTDAELDALQNEFEGQRDRAAGGLKRLARFRSSGTPSIGGR